MKVLKSLNYVERLKMFISRMNPSNYVSDEPDPGILTPFSVGQTITGIDFGNVQNGDTSADMDTFLAGLTYTDMGGFNVCSVVMASNGAIAMAISTADGYVITSVSGGNPVIMYATAAGIDLSSIGISDTSTLGYQNLTGGKIAFGESVEVSAVSSEQGWNGILIGAVEGSAPTPTTYTITPSITNGTASGDNSIEENGTATVTISADTGYELPDSVTVSGASYTYDDTKGAISLSNPTGNVTISATCPAEQQGLTAIAVNDELTSIGFDTALTAQEVVAILDTLTYTDGVCPLVEASGTGTEETGHSIVDAYKTEDENDVGSYNYGIAVGTSLDGQSGDISHTVVFDDNGFTNLTDGRIAIGITPSPVVTSVDATTGWNGVLLGK